MDPEIAPSRRCTITSLISSVTSRKANSQASVYFTINRVLVASVSRALPGAFDGSTMFISRSPSIHYDKGSWYRLPCALSPLLPTTFLANSQVLHMAVWRDGLDGVEKPPDDFRALWLPAR